MYCPSSEIAKRLGSLPTLAGWPTEPEKGSKGVMLLPPAPALEGTLAKAVCVTGSKTMSLAMTGTSLTSMGVGEGEGEGVGVAGGVGVGVGTGWFEGTRSV